MIEVDIQFKRGTFELDCRISDSGFIGLTGPNGSGKSTFLHLLTGVEVPDSGHIRVGESDITYLPINERRVVYLNPDTYFGHADVDRHLSWGLKEENEGRRPSIVEIKERLGITFSGKVTSLSLGQRARVILGTAMLASPRLILIDELLANISGREAVVDYIKENTADAPIDVIFITQDTSDLEKAGSVYRMESGKLARIK